MSKGNSPKNCTENMNAQHTNSCCANSSAFSNTGSHIMVSFFGHALSVCLFIFALLLANIVVLDLLILVVLLSIMMQNLFIPRSVY